MKKNGILNSHISEVLSRMGHTDTIVIADCGLPIPDETIRIDLSLKKGTPSFMETLEAVLADMKIEKVTLAEEIKGNNPEIEKKVVNQIDGVPVDYVSHEELKQLTKKAKAVIRTGEITPYANIILHAGVIF
ncbi:MAG TPA: D-ribose pyranase [Bacillales bacterium]|nr:D-ribose pyranase [Bacillales bacterium]